ncbi:MAG: hypothetical protein ACOC3V_00305 [bacterium]
MIDTIFQHSNHVNPNLWEFYFNDYTDIRYYMESISVPFIAFTPEVRNTGTKHITGYTPENEFSITLHQDNEWKIFDYFYDWRKSIFDNKDKVFGNVNQVKTATFAIQELNDDNELEYSKAFEFENVLLLSITDFTLDYNQTENLKLTANLVADRVYEISPGSVRG